MHRGYIKLYRKITDNTLWNSKEPYCKRAAWIDLICLANHEDNDFLLGCHKVTVKRGQHWTSLGHLGDRWNWGRKKVKNFLDLLESENMIYQESSNRGLLITLVNYCTYQDFLGTKGTAKGIAKEQPRNIKGTSKGTAKGTQTIMNKNDIKNDKKNENIKPAAFEDF